MKQQYIVAGIGTEVGKTVIAAILTEQLHADYWKPVQAGDLHHTDTDKVRQWVSNPVTQFHPEAYRLKTPMSPHGAAFIDGLRIEEEKLALPTTTNHLIIELAGGLMVPLRTDYLIIDWLETIKIPVILVSRFYLGSINHTMLSIDALKRRNIPIQGIIFNGEMVESSKEAILEYSNIAMLGHIDINEPPSISMVKKHVGTINLTQAVN